MRKVLSLLLALSMIAGLVCFASAMSYPGAEQRPGDIEIEIGGGSAGGQKVPGDCNGDGKMNGQDVIHLLWHTMFPEDNGYALKCSGDFNGDGSVNNEDVVYLLWYTMFPDDYPLG